MSWHINTKKLPHIQNFLDQIISRPGYSQIIASQIIGTEYYGALKLLSTEEVIGVAAYIEQKAEDITFQIFSESLPQCPINCPAEIFDYLEPTSDSQAHTWRISCLKNHWQAQAA